MEIIPTDRAVGAEIRGIDLSEPLDSPTLEAIEKAFDEHGVVFFRQQQITPTQQVAFTRHFGEIAFNVFGERWSVPGAPEIVVVSNVTENGEPIGIKRAGERWHSDMSYTAAPPRGTMLHAIEVPELDGLPLGDTMFANAALAWEALPQEMQRRLDGRIGIFDFLGRKRSLDVTEDEIRRHPPVNHPIVRRHPRTGRKSLYIMRDDCTGIEGMGNEEAQPLIEALADHIIRPEFIYRHCWQPGDVLMWDNCTVQHKAVIDYDLPHRRLMHRTTVGAAATM